MSFGSISFLILFLPAAVGIYFLVPKLWLKNLVLVILSLLFYAWGGPKDAFLLLLSILMNYFAALAIQAFADREKRGGAVFVTVLAAAADILALGLYKYGGRALPVGISFYTFTVLSYLFDVCRGRCRAAANPLHMILYVSFFPKLVMGPIVQYEDMAPQIVSRRTSAADFAAGLELFLVGLCKKLLVADYLGAVFTEIRQQPRISGATALFATALFALQLYFDFGGYSDMAVGLARVFGFRFEKNFNYPYISGSVSEFWRRWHISLGAWFRDYVYIPLGGSRKGSGALFFNLLVVWFLTGVWHGSTLNFVVWGLWHGAFVIFEKLVLKERLERIPRAVRIVVTDAVVVFGWCFFFTGSLGESVTWIGRIFCGDGLGFADSAFLYFLRNSSLILIVAVVCCSPFLRGAQKEFSRRGGRYRVALTAAGCAVLLALCIAAAVGSTNTTFLYAQF